MPAQIPAPQSVDRIFTILDHLAVQRAGDTLSALARKADAPKSSVISLLAGMIHCGYLERDGKGRYQLAPRMLSLAMRVMAGRELPELARPLLVQLVEQTGETALVGTLASDADVATYIDKVESLNPVRYTVSLGERRELYSSAIGKLLLTHMPPERRDKYLRSQPLRAFTPATITSARKLRVELEAIRESGVSQTHGERVVGASAMAAPVFGARGEFVAGIVLAGPSERMRSRWGHHEAKVRTAAERLSLLVAGREAETSA